MQCPARGRGRWLGRLLLEVLRSRMPWATGLRIADACLGRRICYVELETGQLGLSFSPCAEPPPLELVEGATVEKLVERAWGHPTLTALALAAFNAATATWLEREGLGEVLWHGELLDVVDLEGVRRVALVGYIRSVAHQLRRMGVEVVVYEDNPLHMLQASLDGYQARQGNQLLAEAEDYDGVVASGAALLDPRLLMAVEKAGARLLGLVGPTASIHPEAARRIGAEAVAGCYVPPSAREKVKLLVRLGYGFRRISKHVLKWVVESL